MMKGVQRNARTVCGLYSENAHFNKEMQLWRKINLFST
jgi:hypothetical protein